MIEGIGLGITSVDQPDGHPLTTDPSDGNAAFTSDGRIAFLRNTPDGRSAFLVKPGGEPVRFSPLNLVDVDASPTAPELLLLVRGREGIEPWRQPLDGSPARRLSQALPGVYFRARFSPDGRRAQLVSAVDLTELRLDGSSPPAVLYRVAASDEIDEADYAGDGSLLVQLMRRDGDLWLARGRF